MVTIDVFEDSIEQKGEESVSVPLQHQFNQKICSSLVLKCWEYIFGKVISKNFFV